MDAKKPLISVIVPVYNVEKYLPKCLDSLLAQTWQELEIIGVDDGSPDNSWDIMQEYARRDSRVRPIRQKNGGLSAARRLRGPGDVRAALPCRGRAGGADGGVQLRVCDTRRKAHPPHFSHHEE